MQPPKVSVIVVSRGRPDLLPRCLTGLGQLFYPAFEIIVVADPDGVRAVASMGWQARVKTVAFDQANISAARNAGIVVAAGEVIAFIDDDAVPEPTWLTHLIAPFANPQVVAAGGYVRGRNGISFQFRAGLVTQTGEDVPLDAPGEVPFSPALPPGHALKTMGTNCAFRRQDVALIGGLDPVFRFFHDETDLNMRLLETRKTSVVVPLAQVHHGYAASARRGADRVPHSLFEIGASSMAFLRKHAPENLHEAALARLRAEQRRRLIRHMVGGGLEPRDVDRLLHSLEAGLVEGRGRALKALDPLPTSTAPFLPFARTGTTHGATLFAGRTWHYRRLRRQAMQSVAKGNVTSVFRFSPTGLYHDVAFMPEGYWLQKGGLFGRANRTDSAFKLTSFKSRVTREWSRVARLRQNLDFSPVQGDADGH